MPKNKYRNVLIGLFVFIIYGYIGYRFSKLDFSVAQNLYLSGSTFEFTLLIVAQLALMLINICSESFKWKILMKKEYHFTFLQSLRMVLAGCASGLISPAKLGEPIGRFLYLPKTKWISATLLSYFGGFIQNLVIIILGVISSVYFYLQKSDELFQQIAYRALFIIVLLIALVSVVWVLYSKYLHHPKLPKLLVWKNRVKSFFIAFKKISFTQILIVTLVCIGRYGIFCTQLYVFFIFFQPSLSFDVVLVIFIYFMGITVFPSFVLVDLGIRNSIGLFLFKMFQINDFIIIASVSLLWIVNQVVPSLLGSFFIYNIRRK